MLHYASMTVDISGKFQGDSKNHRFLSFGLVIWTIGAVSGLRAISQLRAPF
jgi:hypothetical protein